MTSPTPDREQEIRARAEAATPMTPEREQEIRGVLATLSESRHLSTRTAVTAGQELLAENARLRADRDAAVAAARRSALEEAAKAAHVNVHASAAEGVRRWLLRLAEFAAVASPARTGRGMTTTTKEHHMPERMRCGNDPRAQLTPGDRAAVEEFREYLMASTLCQWWEDGHGGRYLVPGCMTRINNPDVEECDCPSVERQLEKARQELAATRRELASLQSWHDAIVRSVHDHRDSVAIMKNAADA